MMTLIIDPAGQGHCLYTEDLDLRSLGPMHIARALGVPTLAFFGCTNPSQFDFSGHALMFTGIECAPCSLFGRTRCPKKHFRCMLDIDVGQVFETLEGLLSRSTRVPFARG